MKEFNYKDYLQNNRLLNEEENEIPNELGEVDTKIDFPSPEEIVSSFENYFSEEPKENYYYATYKGIPLTYKGKLKVFSNPSLVKRYINSQLGWSLKDAMWDKNEDTPFEYNFIDQYPKEIIGTAKQLIWDNIEINAIK